MHKVLGLESATLQNTSIFLTPAVTDADCRRLLTKGIENMYVQ